VARLVYAAGAWHGLTRASHRRRIDALFHRARRQGYTARRICRRSKNSVTLQTMNFAAKQSDCRITFYMICYLHLPPHRNITNSGTASIHYNCLNIPHACQIATFFTRMLYKNTY